MTILNAYLLHKSYGRKMTHTKFPEILVRDLIVQSHKANITVSGISLGRPSSSGAQLSRLEVKHSQHWPSKRKQRRCHTTTVNNLWTVVLSHHVKRYSHTLTHIHIHPQSNRRWLLCKSANVGIAAGNTAERYLQRICLTFVRTWRFPSAQTATFLISAAHKQLPFKTEAFFLNTPHACNCFLLGREQKGHGTISWLHLSTVVHYRANIRPVHKIIDCTMYVFAK
jgi:hypothetical protein